jgi:uncharacterized protein (DUF58 family)
MIPQHVMRELRYIELMTARKIRNQRVGAYQSPLRGPGFDFDEHQPYRPGDDVRRIDWNVTARVGAPYVRHTHAERELNVVVAMDVSRSMLLGGAGYSKREALTFITGSILFSALSDQVNTGFLAYSDRVHEWTPPRRARAAAWDVLQKMWAVSSGAKRTSMAPAIAHLLTSLKRVSMVFFVSDFMLADDSLASRPLTELGARHDLIAVVPQDPQETHLPSGAGYLRLRDLETGKRVTVALNGRSRAAYEAAARERRDALVRAFYRVPMDHVFVPTDRSPVLPVLSLFARRLA